MSDALFSSREFLTHWTERPLWYAEVNLTHVLLKSGRCDLDAWLSMGAPPSAEGPHRIELVRVLPSDIPNVVRFYVLARASGMAPKDRGET